MRHPGSTPLDGSQRDGRGRRPVGDEGSTDTARRVARGIGLRDRSCRVPAIAALALGLGTLAGCEAPADDIDAWMQAQRTQTRVAVPPLPAMQAFEAVPYARTEQTDPFHPSRLLPAPAAPGRTDPRLARELERAPQALEAYPLGQIAMIGSLIQPGRAEALVRVDGRVHVVRSGDRLGQDRGRVIGIGERHIELREWVRDEAGTWQERDNRIDLRETAR